MNDELTELHPDKQLALRIENGEVTKEEVENVWKQTSDLSAQTPFDVRRAVIELRKQGELNDAWPVYFTSMMTYMSEMRGAMTRDESKFAHLVAGAESIVKTLQAVNPLNARLEAQTREIQDLRSEIAQLTKLVREVTTAKAFFAPEGTGPAIEAEMNARTPEIMDFEEKDEQARKETIGSAWAKPSA